MSHVDTRPVSLTGNSSNNSSVATPRYHQHLDHRFSLDVDQPFEAIECRPNRRDIDHSANQWFYDEFSGIYRHKAPPGHHHTDSYDYQNTTKISKIQASPSLKQQHFSQTPSIHQQDQQVITSPQSHINEPITTPSLSWQQILTNGLPYPPPESIEQIYSWRDETRQQPQWMLLLACHLMNISIITLTIDQHIQSVASHEAVRLLKRLIQYRGSSVAGEAHFLLANYYGFQKKSDQAFIMYTQASKQNHGEATYRTAVCHELGLGTHQDLQRAFVFYRKAAHLGHPASMYKMGMVLLEGQLSQPIHKREAVSWLQRAAETHLIPLAQHTLAMVHLIPTSSKKTNLLISSSLSLNNKNNKTKQGVTRHRSHYHSNNKKNDDTGVIIEDHPYAIGLLYEAAQDGYAPSQVKLAECFEQGQFIHPDMELALYWYTKAAESGNNAEAALALSGIHLTGHGALEPSDRQAYLWARKAVTIASIKYRKYGAHRWTLAKASYMVGYFIEHGIGIHDDGKEKDKGSLDPIKWYKKAADLGHAVASKRYISLVSSTATVPAATATTDVSEQKNGTNNNDNDHPNNKYKDIFVPIKWYKKVVDLGHTVASKHITSSATTTTANV
ncbi:hypothetical protein INT45_000200 [Circinella minor]|uniref:HCP-like protein n=1 Tax=Circinella minor TaxID=1195481 RepID=A0A8H7VJK6_9FUNG|nr:hypothetical protein INT45_000200 [Circinella minor]